MQWTLSLVALVLAGLACLYPMSLAEELEATAQRFEARLQEAARPATAVAAEELPALRKRIAELEQALARQRLAAPASARAPAETSIRPSPEPAVSKAKVPKVTHAQRQALARLSAEVMAPGFDYEAGTETMAALIKLARSDGLVDARITELEAMIAAQPDDLRSRERLAEVYFAKLMTVAGPEQGVYHGRAQAQWKAILQRDPDHLRAHLALGHGYAYYPDATGKTQDAIRHLERARRLQEIQGAKVPGATQTYLVLARLYQRRGEKAKARDLLEEGLRHHAADPKLRRALEGM